MVVHVKIHIEKKKIIFGGFKHEFDIKLPHFLSFLELSASLVYKAKFMLQLNECFFIYRCQVKGYGLKGGGWRTFFLNLQTGYIPCIT